MEIHQGIPALLVCESCAGCREQDNSRDFFQKLVKWVFLAGLLALAAGMPFAPSAFAQIHSTISCPSGHGYWDVLSVMMMDPGLASNYHMEGFKNGLPSAYIYTRWDEAQSKILYTKNPQGNPWDINLYDSSFVYQWVTELGQWNGVNHWNDPRSCKKFNSGSQTSRSDLSMRWAARCAVPGGENSAFWNPPTPLPNNTTYLTYVDGALQSPARNLGWSLMELKSPGTLAITDHRAWPARSFSITTLPLDYTYSCSVGGNVNSCHFREVFEYGFDPNVNPVDRVKHTYGWVRWRYYVNSTNGNPNVAANWVLNNWSTTDHLMLGQVSPNFQCF